jgi:probable aminopeptidase NPEPL1
MPILFCPEFMKGEFASEVADMKNTAKERAAGSSNAAQFIHNHMGDFKGRWAHVDIAYPVHIGERASGYGVALLLELLKANKDL